MLRKSDTSARHVHAVLAAAIDDPSLLERLRRQGKSSNPTAQNIALDFDQVRLFAGLAVKVRQNDLRLSLPLTFKLLDRLKISVELFASYAKVAAVLRKTNKKSREDKIRSLFEFLDRWLDRENPEHAFVWDMIRHERVLKDLGKSAATSAPVGLQTSACKKVAAKSVPVRSDQTIRFEMSCNPLELEEALRRSRDLSTIQRGQFHYVYRWDDLQGCVSVSQIDELGCVLFDYANGRRSVARIAALLRQAGIPVDAKSLCDAVQEMSDKGTLTLKE
jgi:hypothetical protein